MIELANNKLAVTISEKGAELQSVKFNNAEYLWQADEHYWGKHAPVLFPVVGQLKEDTYVYEGKAYKLPRHGFAREKTFEANKTADTSVICTLRSNEDTLCVYPFMFILQVKYELKGSTLICRYVVQNTDVKTIFFSLGGHPAFKVPLSEGLSFSDYCLKFNKDTVLHRYLLHDGLIGDEVKPVILNDKKLVLQHDLFYDDAIVLKQFKSDEIELRSYKDSQKIKFKFKEFPYLGIWSSNDAPFVCIEPWCGIADSVHTDQQFICKEGINDLAAGERWERTWSIDLS